jgi:hypothetical protein
MMVEQSVPLSHWIPALLRSWTLLTTITWLVMLTHQSDAPTFFGRFSTPVAAQLTGLALFSIAGWYALWLLKRHPTLHERITQWLANWRAKYWFAPVVLTVAGIGLSVIWVWFLGDHLPTYAVLRWYIAFSILVAALALLYGGRVTSPVLSWHTIILIALGIVSITALVCLSFYPVLAKADEASDFSMARNALEHGHLAAYMYRHAYPTDYFGGLWTWLMAGWLKIAGVSFESGRLYTFILGGLSTIFIGLAASRLYDRITGWTAVLVAAFSFIALNHIRYHIHAAVWHSLGLFFYSLAYKRDRWWMHLLAGFTIAMAIDSTPLAYCFGVGLGLAYSWEYLQSIRRERRWFWLPFWSLTLGGMLALGLYLLTHAGESFTNNRTTGSMLTFYVEQVRSSLASGSILLQLQNYLTTFLTNRPILFGLVVLGLLTMFRIRNTVDRLLLTVHFVWVVVVFLYIYFPVFYLVMALPLFALIAARGLSAGIPLLLHSPMDRPTALTRALVGLLVVWLLAALAKDIAGTGSQSVEDVVETGRHFGALLPKDSLIVAAEPYYFGMIEHENFVGGSIEVYLQTVRGLPPKEVWPFLSPDAIVFSSGWPLEPQRSPLVLSYMEAEDFVMLRCYQTQSFGRIELWVATVPQGLTPSDQCESVCNPRLGCGA